MTVPTYSAPYPAAQPPRRPATVTIASVLLFAVAAAQLVFAIVAFSTFSKAAPVFDDLYYGTDYETFGSGLVSLSVVMIILYGLLGVGLVLLGVFNLRGKQPSRVITWIVSGFLMCCSVIMPYVAIILVTRFAEAVGNDGSTRMPTQRELDARLDGVVPESFEPIAVLFTLFALVALITVIILLAVPPSNMFFRKQVAGWNPYQAGYPQQPAYGQPYPGGYAQQPGAGDPAYGQPGQPAPGLPQYPGQQPYGPPTGSPSSGQPYGAPSSGQPYGTPPGGYPPVDPYAQGYPGQPAPYPGQPAPYPGQPGQPGSPYGPAPTDPTSAPSQSGGEFAAPQPPPADHGPANDPWATPSSAGDQPSSAPPALPPSPDDEQRPPQNPA